MNAQAFAARSLAASRRSATAGERGCLRKQSLPKHEHGDNVSLKKRAAIECVFSQFGLIAIVDESSRGLSLPLFICSWHIQDRLFPGTEQRRLGRESLYSSDIKSLNNGLETAQIP